MTVVHAAGGVVLLDEPFTAVLLVVHRDPPELRLPKGLVEENESLAEAALREVLEETGVGGTIGARVGTARWNQEVGDRMLIKEVAFFLIENPVWISAADDPDVRGLVLADISIATDLLTFEEERRILREALARKAC